jgi:hypothetical protein
LEKLVRPAESKALSERLTNRNNYAKLIALSELQRTGQALKLVQLNPQVVVALELHEWIPKKLP